MSAGALPCVTIAPREHWPSRRDFYPDWLEPAGLRQLLLPRLPAHRPCKEGIARLSRVPDSGMHEADGVRRVRDGSAAEICREDSGPLTACCRNRLRHGSLADVTFAGEAKARRREWALVRSRTSGATRPPRKSFYLQKPESFYLQKHLPLEAANASTSRNLPCGLILVMRRRGRSSRHLTRETY
jgi:hypothetical protein